MSLLVWGGQVTAAWIMWHTTGHEPVQAVGIQQRIRASRQPGHQLWGRKAHFWEDSEVFRGQQWSLLLILRVALLVTVDVIGIFIRAPNPCWPTVSVKNRFHFKLLPRQKREELLLVFKAEKNNCWPRSTRTNRSESIASITWSYMLYLF